MRSKRKLAEAGRPAGQVVGGRGGQATPPAAQGGGAQRHATCEVVGEVDHFEAIILTDQICQCNILFYLKDFTFSLCKMVVKQHIKCTRRFNLIL